MIDDFISMIAPHHCCGCGKIGGLLCDDCKYNIIHEPINSCLVCNRPTNSNCLCNTCKVPFNQAWVVGERNGILQRLIGLYKFERAISAYEDLGGLLVDILPELPSNCIVIPIPTVSSHIRERGYDHMLLIAKYIAKARNLKCRQLIYRQTNTKQRQKGARQRIEQAKRAFGLKGNIDTNVPYLLIDDVYTTGATIKCASQILRKAGAKQIFVAIIARQTLD